MRINAGLDDSAQVRPVVTKVEHIDELLRCLEVRQPLPAFVEDIVVHIRAWRADSSAIRKLEFMQMRAIPACEGVVNGSGQLAIRMVYGRSEHAARPRPVALPSTLDQLDPDR